MLRNPAVWFMLLPLMKMETLFSSPSQKLLEMVILSILFSVERSSPTGFSAPLPGTKIPSPRSQALRVTRRLASL